MTDLQKLIADEMHACQTGDCGHGRAHECEAQLAQDSKPADSEKLQHCKKIVTAVYLACEETVAKDISEHMQWLINSLAEAEENAKAFLSQAEEFEKEADELEAELAKWKPLGEEFLKICKEAGVVT